MKKIYLAVVSLAVILITVYILTRPVYIHLTFEVKSPYDDARTFITGLGFGNEDGEWALLQLSPSYSFGVRFANVTLPKDVKLKDAYIELYSVGTPGHSHPNCKIYGDITRNASNFSIKGVLDVCGRNYTKNYVIWNETVEYGTWVKTPSILPIIKEITESGNWSSGDPVVILFITCGVGDYSAAFQNYEKGFPAKLHIICEK